MSPRREREGAASVRSEPLRPHVRGRPRGPAESRSELASDPALRSWYENTANGSRITADVYLRRLLAFCGQMDVDRHAIAGRKVRETDLRDLLVRFVNAEVQKGRSGEYIRSTVKAVKSWLLHHDRRVTLPVKIPGAGSRPSLEEEEIPTPEQLRAVLMGATSNERLCCALMAFSGLRPEVLGNYEGNDGLRVSDLLGVEVDGARLRFPEPPLRIRVRASSSKAGHSYFTFLGAEGVEYLRTVLEERARKGEPIGPDTDVVHPYRAKKRFVRALNVGDQVRLALRRAGVGARPYVLRSYFFSRMLEAQNAGRVAADYIEFWGAHRGGITQKHYTTGRARLPDSLVASMRDAYRRCEPYLSTSTSAGDSGADRILRVFLLTSGLTEEEIGKLDLASMSDADLAELAKRRVADAPAPGPKQLVIAESELPKYLAEGWLARMAVNGSKFVVERAG